MRQEVQEEFKFYLKENIGDQAVQWLELYLAGTTQEDIAKILDLPIKKIYRLREKINYHAVKIFAIKNPSSKEEYENIIMHGAT